MTDTETNLNIGDDLTLFVSLQKRLKGFLGLSADEGQICGLIFNAVRDNEGVLVEGVCVRFVSENQIKIPVYYSKVTGEVLPNYSDLLITNCVWDLGF